MSNELRALFTFWKKILDSILVMHLPSQVLLNLLRLGWGGKNVNKSARIEFYVAVFLPRKYGEVQLCNEKRESGFLDIRNGTRWKES
jgi:hypothetical protein